MIAVVLSSMAISIKADKYTRTHSLIRANMICLRDGLVFGDSFYVEKARFVIHIEPGLMCKPGNMFYGAFAIRTRRGVRLSIMLCANVDCCD